MFPKEVASDTEVSQPALAETYVVLLTPFLRHFASQVTLQLQIVYITPGQRL